MHARAGWHVHAALHPSDPEHISLSAQSFELVQTFAVAGPAVAVCDAAGAALGSSGTYAGGAVVAVLCGPEHDAPIPAAIANVTNNARFIFAVHPLRGPPPRATVMAAEHARNR